MTSIITPKAMIFILAMALPAMGLAQSGIQPMPSLDLSGLSVSIRAAITDAEANLQSIQSMEVDGQTLAGAYGQLGDVLLIHGLTQAAQVAYENAQILEPRRLDWPYLLSVIALEQGNAQGALTLLNGALSLDPWDRASLIRRGRLLLADGQIEAAQNDFSRVLQLDPESAAAMAGLGEAALLQQQYESALTYLQLALERQPSATRLYQPLGLAFRGAGQLDQARQVMGEMGDQDVVFLDPVMDRVREQSRSPQFYQEAALAAADAGDLVGARTLLVQALTLSPNDPLIVTNYGEVLAREGLLPEAREAFLRLIELKPNDPEAWFYLAQVEELLGRGQAATVAYQRLAELSNNDRRADVGLAFVALSSGDYRGARDRFAALVNATSDEDERYRMSYWQAIALVGLEEYSRADQIFQSLMAQTGLEDSDVVMARVRLGATVLTDRSDLNQMLEWAQSLYDATPGIESATTLAMVHAAGGNFLEAQDYQAQAMFEALRDGRLDARPDLAEEMEAYRQEQYVKRPFGKSHPVFSHRSLN